MSHPTEQFLAALGKDPSASYFRVITPGRGANRSRRGADLLGFDAALLAAENELGGAVYSVIGNAGAASGKSGAVCDMDVNNVPALFVEWDDRPIEWQVQAWRALSLPEPTLMVATGGKSVHCYWALREPMAPGAWRELQRRLLEHCDADRKLCNAARVMRVPGFRYIDKGNRRPTDHRCELIHSSNTRYSAAEIEAALPPQEAPAGAPPSTTRHHGGGFPPRTVREVEAAAEFVPARVVGAGTYETSRRALCGCAAALAEAGHPDPEGHALALLAGKWPDPAGAQQALTSSTTRSAAAFWAIAGEHGFNLKRHTRRRQLVQEVQRSGGATPPASRRASRDRVKLEPDEVMERLPERLGRLRLNVRSGDVHTDSGTLTANQIGRLYLELSDGEEKWGKEVTADAVALLASRDPFDPVGDYLDGIKASALPMEQWQRLDQHLLGIDDPIAAAFLPRYLISAVARVFQPGCDVRQLPVLIGPQWRGKTALGRILFGADHWVEGIEDMGRDALMKAGGSWGVELAELDGVTRRSDQERLKAFLTETVDTYRAPYDRAPERHPRRFVFWATSNGAPLRDATGSTRFVCIKLPDRMLPLDWAAKHRDAIWARAVEQYRAGVEWRHCGEAEREAIEARNADHAELDPWADRVAAYLEQADRLQQLPVKVADVLGHLEVPVERQTNAVAKRVVGLALQLGWEQARRRRNGGAPVKGLWPVHPVHPGVHPPCTPAKASNAKRSEAPCTPCTPNQEKLEKSAGAGRGTAATCSAGTFSSFGVHGVHAAENDCAAMDLVGTAGVHAGVPAGVHGQLKPGDPVELLHADGTWRNGWRVACATATTIGTRVRIEAVAGADFRVVGADQIRLCTGGLQP